MSKLKKGIVIYGAGPIDLASSIPEWRQQFMTQLKQRQINGVMFDPSTAFKLSVASGEPAPTRDAYIESTNSQAILRADAMIVVLPKSVPSVGTPIEIDYAKQNETRTYLVTDIPVGKSVYLNNRVDEAHWFSAQLDDASQLRSAFERVIDKITEEIG